MKKGLTTIAIVGWTLQDAAGPNPDNKPYELVDDMGFRYAYVDNEAEAKAEIFASVEALDGMATITTVETGSPVEVGIKALIDDYES